MIFYVFISVVTLIYILAVGALVMELIAHPSKKSVTTISRSSCYLPPPFSISH